MEGDAEPARLDLDQGALDVGADVCLRQHDRGLGAAPPRGREVALEPARVRLDVERGDDEGGVDVGRDDLLRERRARRLADEGRAPGQDVVDRRRPLPRSRRDGHPVARDRVAPLIGLVGEAAGELGGQLAELGHERVEPALLDRHASGHEPVGGVWIELSLELRAPAVA